VCFRRYPNDTRVIKHLENCTEYQPSNFLSKINCLHLLADCIEELYVPQLVLDELNEYKLPAFIQSRTLSEVGAAYVRDALGRLLHGELVAMVLSQELNIDYVIFDDLLVR